MYNYNSLFIVEYFLSQLAMYRLIKDAIGNEMEIRMMLEAILEGNADHIVVNAKRSGPALTIALERKEDVPKGVLGSCTTTVEEKSIFEADFTVALHCPIFPTAAKGKDLKLFFRIVHSRQTLTDKFTCFILFHICI